MYKITNVDALGTEYTVTDHDTGGLISNIRIIRCSEILDAAIGEYNDAEDSYASYLEKSLALLRGTNTIDANKVLWYATHSEDIVLSEIIEFAVKHDYNKIVLEYLEETD